MGDGGGGPKAEVIEKGLRQTNLEGVPRVKFEFAHDFLDRLGKQKSVLPEWIGELYLELHSGTLTSQAAVKLANRKAELGLREIEILYSNLSLEDYPQTQLDYLWKKLLLNQFHDIIPGSSINCVYKDAQSDYLEIFEGLSSLRQKFCAKMARKENSVTLFNSLSVRTDSLIELPDSLNEYALSCNGIVLERQTIANKNYIQIELAPFSSQILQLNKTEKESDNSFAQEEENLILSNKLISYHFNSQGQLIRIYDKEASREVIRSGEIGNCLSLYHDMPTDFEAWDIDLCYEQQLLGTAKLTGHSYKNGALAQVMYCSYTVGDSSLIEQQIVLAHNSKELQFKTQVKWQERRKMLRVSFAVDVQAPTASYEIQYGIVERPTHRNTSWQMAQYEVVGHRFADLSDKQFGVALLNDCKYGYKIHGNSIDLNLLRSPMYPDAEADLGNHECCYSLLPHQESLAFSNVLPQALALNQAPIVLPYVEVDLTIPLTFDNEKIIIEVCKKSESENAWIVRAYEGLGLRQAAAWKLLSGYKISEVNLMERNDRAVDGIITFRPFEIKTFKLSL